MADAPKKALPLNPRLHPLVVFSRLKAFVSFAVWLLALGAFWMVYEDAGGLTSFPGVVETASADVAAVDDGLIREIPVTTGSSVRAGDVVVRMDASVIQAQAALAAREDATTAARLALQYQQSAFEAEASIRELEIEAESARAEMTVLAAEVTRLEPLVEKRLADPKDLSVARARRDALQVIIDRTPAAIAAHQRMIDWASKSLQSLGDATVEIKAAADSEAALANLTSPLTGTVVEIYRLAGTATPAGEPILRIADTANKRVRGLIPEHSADALGVGDWVYVEPVGPGPRIIHAQVSALSPQVIEALSPQVIEMTEPNTLMPSRIVRGRLVWIKLPNNTGLLPGQAVNIRSRISLMDRVIERYSFL